MMVRKGVVIRTRHAFVIDFVFCFRYSAAKKRLKESARDGDNRLSKKARKLAESSLGPKNSILRHMQAAGPGAANRAPSSKKESSKFHGAVSGLDYCSIHTLLLGISFCLSLLFLLGAFCFLTSANGAGHRFIAGSGPFRTCCQDHAAASFWPGKVIHSHTFLSFFTNYIALWLTTHTAPSGRASACPCRAAAHSPLPLRGVQPRHLRPRFRCGLFR